MANFTIMSPSNPNLIGASTDTKPTGVKVGTMCYETDTDLWYATYDGDTWVVISESSMVTALETLAAAGAAYNAPVELISASDIGATDNTWKDQGSEIDCRGYSVITFWIDLTVNDSTGNQMQVLSKRASGGAQEYAMELSADYQKTLGDADANLVYSFELDNSLPYLQVQTKATDVDTGGGTEGTVTINYILGNK